MPFVLEKESSFDSLCYEHLTTASATLLLNRDVTGFQIPSVATQPPPLGLVSHLCDLRWFLFPQIIFPH